MMEEVLIALEVAGGGSGAAGHRVPPGPHPQGERRLSRVRRPRPLLPHPRGPARPRARAQRARDVGPHRAAPAAVDALRELVPAAAGGAEGLTGDRSGSCGSSPSTPRPSTRRRRVPAAAAEAAGRAAPPPSAGRGRAACASTSGSWTGCWTSRARSPSRAIGCAGCSRRRTAIPELLEAQGEVDRLCQDLQELRACRRAWCPCGRPCASTSARVRDLCGVPGQAGPPRHRGRRRRGGHQRDRARPRSADHMVRNAVDHGIERPDGAPARARTPAGRSRCARATSRGAIVLEIADDGAGLDRERILERARRAASTRARLDAERDPAAGVRAGLLDRATRSRRCPAAASAWTWCAATSTPCAARSASQPRRRRAPPSPCACP